MSHRILLSLLFALTLTGPGCCSSKWAMRDPDYAKKYGVPYSENKWEKAQRMSKQMVDARHLEDQGGGYFKGAYSENPNAGMMELGLYHYSRPWLSAHGGLSVLLGEGGILGFPGVDLGMRFQSPSRFAPFVGAGVYTDLSEAIFGDSDEDEYRYGLEDPHSHEDHRSIFAAIYPEVGFHYWLTSGLRMTGSAGYYFNTRGRDLDFLMLGLTFAHMSHPDSEDCAEVLSQDFTADDLKTLNYVENAAIDETLPEKVPEYREASFREMFSDFAPPQDDSIKINLD